MKHLFSVFCCLTMFACANAVDDQPIEVDVASEALSQDMRTAIQNACQSNNCLVSDLQRESIGGGIAHYSATIRVGQGAREVIGLHRVVKETSPWVPKKNLSKSVLLVHGDSGNFKSMFLVGPAGTALSAVSGYLASSNIDVWGMDTRWAKVPAGTTNTSFMQDWDMEDDARDARIAMAVTRAVRGLTGSGIGKIKYLGWSRGGQIGYVVAQQESQISNALRSANGFVIVDVPFKTDDATFQATICATLPPMEARIANGEYAEAGSQAIIAAGQLATADPNGTSPIVPGLTNIQVILLFGGATYNFQPYLPWYHMVGANIHPEFGIPVSLRFTDLGVFTSVTTQIAPFESLGTMLQGNRAICQDTPLDDHLDDITAPLFYIGANGGFGDLGLYTTTLVGSSDVDTVTIELTGDKFTDFGHDDVFRATNAPTLVFAPLLSWLQSH